jgi:hypothetical protein
LLVPLVMEELRGVEDFAVGDLWLRGVDGCLKVLVLVFFGERSDVVEDGCGDNFSVLRGDARLEDPLLSGIWPVENKACFLGERLLPAWELREDDVDSDKGRLLVVDDAPDSVFCLGVRFATI